MAALDNGTEEKTYVEEELLQSIDYFKEAPANRTAAKAIHSFNYWLKIPDDKLSAIEEIVGDFHAAGLIVDDIEDNAIQRRGQPVAHRIFGVSLTINSAFIGASLAIDRAIDIGGRKGAKICTQQLINTNRGQGLEISWREFLQCPTEEQYRFMAIKKNGSLFALGVQLMQLFSENKSDFSKLVEIMGLYLQIRNDYLDVATKNPEKRPNYEDASNGTFSFPSVHAINSHPKDRQVLSILRQRTKDETLLKHYANLLDKFGSLSYTRDVMKQLDLDARKEVALLGGNPGLEAVLDALKKGI